MYRRRNLVALALLPVLMWLPAMTQAHCQIPCGIYDDDLRFDLMEEHIRTVEKGMKEITDLSQAGDRNYNQLVRWIANKDEHADKFMSIVTQYFMTQRIKPVAPADSSTYEVYLHEVTLMHQMMVTAMKCKQATDLKHTARLSMLLQEFRALYSEHHKH